MLGRIDCVQELSDSEPTKRPEQSSWEHHGAGRFCALFPRARGAGCRTAPRIADVAMVNGDPAVAPMLRLRAFAQVSGAVLQHLSTTLSQGVCCA